MAIMSNKVRKVTELPETWQINNSDIVMLHDGRGLKKVTIETFKNGIRITPTNATSNTAGSVKPDNVTTEVNNGAIKAKTATRGSVGVVKPDGSTINIDGNGTLSVNKSGLNINSVEVSTKIINQNGNQPMKFWYGTKSQYNALSYKDPNTVYDCSEG